jgi:hypothetical protein
LLASNSNKVRDLELTQEIKDMGFTTARIIGKLLTLTHKSTDAAVQCQFDINNIPVSIKRLQNAIATNDKIALDENYHAGKFAVYFTDMLVQSVEHEYAKHESERTQDQEDKQKIVDEINKYRSTLADISLGMGKKVAGRSTGHCTTVSKKIVFPPYGNLLSLLCQ